MCVCHVYLQNQALLAALMKLRIVISDASDNPIYRGFSISARAPHAFLRVLLNGSAFTNVRIYAYTVRSGIDLANEARLPTRVCIFNTTVFVLNICNVFFFLICVVRCGHYSMRLFSFFLSFFWTIYSSCWHFCFVLFKSRAFFFRHFRCRSVLETLLLMCSLVTRGRQLE